MDLGKLKKRASFPFETIAVAISFSPSCEFILAEAKILSDSFGASLLLVHIGDKTSEKEQRLDDIMTRVGIMPNDSRVIWMEGEPVETILKLCKLNIVDLLVMGALEKENIFKFYLGSIARNISRKAKCSVLLLTNPGTNSIQLKKFVVNGVENLKTIHTVNTAVYVAQKLNVSDLTIVNEIEVPGLAMTIAEDSTAPQTKEIKKNLAEKSEQTLQKILDKCDFGNMNVINKIVEGKPGYAISAFARNEKADLLVINSPDTNLTVFDRIFTHDIEFILADLPCNVLIVHSRV